MITALFVRLAIDFTSVKYPHVSSLFGVIMHKIVILLAFWRFKFLGNLDVSARINKFPTVDIHLVYILRIVQFTTKYLDSLHVSMLTVSGCSFRIMRYEGKKDSTPIALFSDADRVWIYIWFESTQELITPFLITPATTIVVCRYTFGPQTVWLTRPLY